MRGVLEHHKVAGDERQDNEDKQPQFPFFHGIDPFPEQSLSVTVTAAADPAQVGNIPAGKEMAGTARIDTTGR
ncbi:hypothetical protein GCM10025772_11240 [Ferrimonas gelatinilytica]|uniref:Uncharacterized protein n=1 Tax=Ferrimonas gelatinilytica TaxID=1255257 RepID=A0ABP9S097_9GAMM